MKYNNDTRERLYLKAIAMFGVKSRLGKALEEFCEVSASITRFLTRPEGHSSGQIRDSLFEELADASIMVEQLKVLFADQTDTRGRSIAQIQEEKLARFEKLMNGMENA